MEHMNAWWGALPPLTKGFFGVAILFSIVFFWQMIMAFVGLSGGDASFDSHVDASGAHHADNDNDASVAAFKLLSFRSLLAFGMLFAWDGALNLHAGMAVSKAMFFAVLWGLAAMVLVALLLHMMRRMSETGNPRFATCIGGIGTVYLDIPGGNGTGEIRMLCGGVMTHLKARDTAGKGLKAGATVQVVRLIGADTVEVAPTGTVSP